MTSLMVFLGAWLWSLSVIYIDTNEGTELDFPDWKVLGTICAADEVTAFGTYDEREIWSLEGFTSVAADSKF